MCLLSYLTFPVGLRLSWDPAVSVPHVIVCIKHCHFSTVLGGNDTSRWHVRLCGASEAWKTVRFSFYFLYFCVFVPVWLSAETRRGCWVPILEQWVFFPLNYLPSPQMIRLWGFTGTTWRVFHTLWVHPHNTSARILQVIFRVPVLFCFSVKVIKYSNHKQEEPPPPSLLYSASFLI